MLPLLAISILLIVPNGLFCIQCIPAEKYVETLAGIDEDRAISKPTVLANEGNNRASNTVCRVQIATAPLVGHLSVEYFGNKNLKNLTEELTVVTSFSYFNLGFSYTANIIDYVCSSSDYCESDFVENWVPWLRSADYTVAEEKIGTIMPQMVGQDNDRGLCYNGSRVQTCSSRFCTIERHDGVLSQGCLDSSNDLTSLLEKEPIIVKLLSGSVSVVTTFNVSTINLHEFNGDIASLLTKNYPYKRNLFLFCVLDKCNEESALLNVLSVLKSHYNLGAAIQRRSTITSGKSKSTVSLERKKRTTGFTPDRQRLSHAMVSVIKIVRSAMHN